MFSGLPWHGFVVFVMVVWLFGWIDGVGWMVLFVVLGGLYFLTIFRCVLRLGYAAVRLAGLGVLRVALPGFECGGGFGFRFRLDCALGCGWL